MTAASSAPLGALLRQAEDGPIVPDPRTHGFGGVHGGLILALLTSAMQRRVPDALLQSASARLHRAVTEKFEVSTALRRSGSISTLTAEATTDQGPHIDASAVFAGARTVDCPPVTPPAPPAPQPLECEVYQIPPEFVPISIYWQIRPVGPNRPYAGCDEPELTAWVRLVEDDAPPDPHRLVLLMDALAPSYSAVLSDLVLIPTVELTVRPRVTALAAASSPWVLLHARTLSADTSGWSEEVIDAWDPDGVHLGSAHQLRLFRRS